MTIEALAARFGIQPHEADAPVPGAQTGAQQFTEDVAF